MYGKVFASMYDGTLRVNWKAMVTMQQLIILATPDGVVDMTADAIASRTAIPVEIISEGIAFLEAPDPSTRTPGDEGRRIVRLDDHRSWGWRLVNHAKYRALRNMEEKREADRKRIAVKRLAERKSLTSKGVARASQHVAGVAHTDTDSDSKAVDKGIVGLAPDAAPADGKEQKTRVLRAMAVQILVFLNSKASRNYQPLPANIDLIVARLRDGASVEDCYAVIAKKCREWLGDAKMNVYLRPATLFNRTNFAQYQGELVAKAA